MKKRNQVSSQCGYTIAEMAIVLAIVSVVVGMSVSAGMTQMEIARNGSTKATLENIRQALLVYHKKKGVLPCPADPTLVETDAAYGEPFTGGCNPVCTPPLLCVGDAVIGAVPFKEIKLNPESAVDAWDRKITYVIDKDFTVLTNGNTYYKLGSLIVQDSAGEEVTTSPAMGDAMFVLISHGEDGGGAYPKNSPTQIACVAGQADASNCDFADDVFVDEHIKNNPEVPASYFDDIVAWQSQQNLDIENPLEDDNSCDVALDAAERITCAIASNGTPYCWGDNTKGSYGDGGNSDSTTPTPAMGGGTDWISFSTSASDGVYGHSCGIRTDGTLSCAGENGSGQLGNGMTSDSNSPVAESTGGTDWLRVEAGEAHTCAQKTNGRLFCWGFNNSGQLGNGNKVDQHSPVEVSGIHFDWTYFTTGANHSCGIRNNGEAYCWGENSSFQLGLGDSSTADRTTPQLLASGSNWVQINASNDHTCGVTATQKAFCWGRGSNGQLGDGDTTNKDFPMEVQPAQTGWTEIAAGNTSTCGIRDGHLWCWGNRAESTIPDGGGTAGNQMTPIEADGLHSSWLNISMDRENACAIRSDTGKFYCWGTNNKGQIGDGTTNPSDIPIEIGSISACDT